MFIVTLGLRAVKKCLGCTHLGLCDLVLASSNAYFYCPFTNLGQSAEASSSHTFTKTMGRLQANAMIMFNKKFNAQQVFFLQNSYFMAHIKPIYPRTGDPGEIKNGSARWF